MSISGEFLTNEKVSQNLQVDTSEDDLGDHHNYRPQVNVIVGRLGPTIFHMATMYAVLRASSHAPSKFEYHVLLRC